MRDFFNQIEESIRANLYYVGLIGTLCIPDICGAIDSEDGIGTKQKYIAWFDKYVGASYSRWLSGEDCYYFRCSLLHQGSSQHAKSTYSRILFVEPTATSNVFHMNVFNGALNIDVRLFCSEFIGWGRQWLSEVEGTERYKVNYDKFMRRYPNGLPPYIVGLPVIG